MPAQTPLADIRRQLDEFDRSVERCVRAVGSQRQTNQRLRLLAWGAIAIGLGLAVVAFFLWREAGHRVDAIQESRRETCEATNRTVVAVKDRDEDLVGIAVRFAEEQPAVADAIVRELDDLPSADALEPIDCEAATDD